MSELKLKKQEYKSLLDDYKILQQNLKDNVARKKLLRDEIKELQKQVKIEKAKKILASS